MPLVAVSAVSASTIAYEILLMRLYSIGQWHHFAYMIISIALLGYGASGTFLALARRRLLERFLTAWQINAAAFGLTAVLGYALTKRLDVNPLELAWDPRLLVRLPQTYLLLMIPFFCAANCVGLAFMGLGARIARIYRYDLAGAGIGAAAVIAMLFALPPSTALRLLPLVGFAAAAVAGLGSVRLRRVLWLGAAGALVALLLPESWLAPAPSQYKPLSQALRIPGARIVHESSSPLGLITIVDSPQVPFRLAPGLSLASPVSPPAQLGLFVDGEGPDAIARMTENREQLAYLDYGTAALPYHLLESPAVLVLGPGGGTEVLRARYHGVSRLAAVEPDPALVRLLRAGIPGYVAPLYDPAIALTIAAPRAGAAAASAVYDLIQIPALEAAGAAVGLAGLSEAYAYTLEAFQSYLARLRPGGLIALTRPLDLPPRDSLKLFATALEALRRSGEDRPGERLAMIRGWATVTLLVRQGGPFTAAEIAALRAFCRGRAFDPVYYPGMAREEANQANLLEAPVFHDGAVALLGPQAAEFLDRYKFDLRPATDDRPYFFDFLKWRFLPELLALRQQGAMALIELGPLILLATLLQALALGVLLILLPLRALRQSASSSRQRLRVGLYFLALGLAFLFVEIAFIQRLVLFLGHPIHAVAVVLASFLLFAGLGAGLAPRLAAARAHARLSALDLAVAGIALIVVLYVVFLPPALAALVALPAAAKVAMALALIAPLAFCMGLPFPLGLARVADAAPSLVPWAWGINGCASVVSAVLATLLAIEFGFAAVVACAVALYMAAALVFRRAL